MTAIRAVRATEEGLIVHTGGTATTLSWRWVRDHGEDPASYDPATQQRRVYALDAAAPKAAVACELSIEQNQSVIALTWPEAPKQTWITQATLLSLLDPSGGTPNLRGTTLWNGANDTSVTKGDVDQVLTDDSALASWLQDVASHGYAVLGGFSGGHEETTALASRIGYVRETIFGGTWDLAADLSEHEDTAYTQAFLAPHTDGTYSHDAPGLQMFCCVERTGTGGESIIVDAFAIAETLRSEFPDDFAVLTSVEVPGHYVEPGVELRASRPAIRLDSSGSVAQVSMNNYDRSPMLLPHAEMEAFYRAYGRLHELANDPTRWLALRLEPGDVLINDNWRVLHGRHAYTGSRRFIGCYLNHEDFESRLRVLTAP